MTGLPRCHMSRPPFRVGLARWRRLPSTPSSGCQAGPGLADRRAGGDYVWEICNTEIWSLPVSRSHTTLSWDPAWCQLCSWQPTNDFIKIHNVYNLKNLERISGIIIQRFSCCNIWNSGPIEQRWTLWHSRAFKFSSKSTWSLFHSENQRFYRLSLSSNQISRIILFRENKECSSKTKGRLGPGGGRTQGFCFALESWRVIQGNLILSLHWHFLKFLTFEPPSIGLSGLSLKMKRTYMALKVVWSHAISKAWLFNVYAEVLVSFEILKDSKYAVLL